MKTVLSPKLFNDGFVLATARDTYWCCVSALEKYVEIPPAKCYWLQASTKQWEDRSGVALAVRIKSPLDVRWLTNYHNAEWRVAPGEAWQLLYDVLNKSLRHLGLHSDGPSKTIYFRLLYEE